MNDFKVRIDLVFIKIVSILSEGISVFILLL